MKLRPRALDACLLAELYSRQDQVIDEAEASSPPALEGAGIVIVAGGAQAFTNAWVGLTNLRCVQQTRLPIQVWHLGPEEFSPAMRAAIRRFDVELVDAFEIRRRHPIRRLGPWECKAFASLHSPFRHVILMDADNVPLIDPAMLLDTEPYVRAGGIFWPDNHMHLPESPVWELFDVPYREELEVESGQLVVDKERCWVPLNLAVHYNAWSDIYYRFVYGDKETFHFAWRRADQQYAMPEERPRTVYCERETPYGRRRMTAALEQSDFDGNVIFHHRTGGKWMLDGENPTTGRPELDAVCLDALSELRTCWDGRVANDPVLPRSASRHRAVGGRYRFRRVGLEERTVTLEPDGWISGPVEDGRWWRCDGDRITLGDQQGPFCYLDRCPDGVWRGRELWYERPIAELVPHD